LEIVNRQLDVIVIRHYAISRLCQCQWGASEGKDWRVDRRTEDHAESRFGSGRVTDTDLLGLIGEST